MAEGKNYTVKEGDNLSTIAAQNPDLGYSSWTELRDANLEEIKRVGRLKMEGLVGLDVTRSPCGISGHTGGEHLIDCGIHYDHPGAPTIYPGTTLFLKAAGKPPAKDDAGPAQEQEEPAAEEIHKRWSGIEHQSPIPRMEIFTEGDPGKKKLVYDASLQAETFSKFLSYNFAESTDSLEGSFSFTVENEEDGDGRTTFDLIPLRSVVRIYEGGVNPAFVGIVRRRSLSKSMSAQGARRAVTFSGKSIISCITEYTLSLDVRIHDVEDGTSHRNNLLNELTRKGEPLSIKEFMAITWRHFREVSEHAGISTTGIADIINKFIGDGDPEAFIEASGQEQRLRYDIAATFYSAANNVIADVWRNILPERAYELFSRCGKDGKPRIVARQVPFGDPDNGNDDWIKTPIYRISPISLTAYALEQGDEEVYTAFSAHIIGSARDRNFELAKNQGEKDSIVQHDREKQKIYGYRPLEIDFNGYNRAGNTRNAKIDPLTQALQELNKRASYWYSRLDEMYSGSITICTDFNEPETNPRAGCRAKFLGGQFYITRAEHSWQFGGTPTIVLSVSRGMMYDGEKGKMAGPIENVSRQYRELEEGA